MADSEIGIRNQERIVALERDMGETKEAMHEQLQKLDEIRNKLLGRPTWTVALAFASMVTIIAALLQALLT